MKLEITKERVLEAASKCSTAKATLTVLFPEVFGRPSMFKEGAWLIIFNNEKSYTTHDDLPYRGSRNLVANNGLVVRYTKTHWPHGVEILEVEDGERNYFLNAYGLRLATPEEIEEHLKKEANKKGFKDGVKVNRDVFKGISSCSISHWAARIYGDHVVYNKEEDAFLIGGVGIYYQGQWATIVEETKEERIAGVFKKHNYIGSYKLFKELAEIQ